MKLLKLKIGNDKKGFKSLHPGFEIEFHSLDNYNAMREFNPFCFAGLNGSGKSNVLEALSFIFYHLEFCVALYQPKNFEEIFNREKSWPDAYTLEYLIGQHHRKDYTLLYFDKVTIKKEVGKEPRMFLKSFPFDETVDLKEVSLQPSKSRKSAAEGKDYLPAHVIAYSSGENETLSIPFIKSRLVHLDEYKQATKDGLFRYDEPENSLIYIDKNMSQAVLLTSLLFENTETLKPLKEEIGIEGLRSFRIHLNLHNFDFKVKKKEVQILSLLEEQIDKLKRCATSWFSDKNILWLDFFVNDATKQAFKSNFQQGSFELFQLFRILYELNYHFIEESIVKDIYQSKGFYSEGKIPEGNAEQIVFYFSDFYITKIINEKGEKKDLLLSDFSDGEHQFLHTMGISILLKAHRTILLLDEPETHFNPSWRAKFIKVLNDSIVAGHPGGFFIHLLKDILLTSHSPFIISDCLPNNVIFFDKDANTNNIKAQKASELGLNTYGASVDYITTNFFKTDLISSKSYSELTDIIEKGTLEELQFAIERFGESSAKQFLYKKIYEKLELEDDNDD